MRSEVFLDTSGWLALLNQRDRAHGIAVQRWRELGRQHAHVVVTDWIIAETGNGLARSGRKSVFAKAAERLLSSNFATVQYIDAGLLQSSLTFMQERQDKDWGLVDCASFLVMRTRGIASAFTMDRHFEQAGFEALLR